MKKIYAGCALAFVFTGTQAVAESNVELGTMEVISSSLGYEDIDAVKIQTRNASMLKDVMRDIPGVYVGGTNSFNQKLYMRGVNDRGLNITVDGARQRGNAFHHGADLVVDTDVLKKVDISTGLKSVVGNSGALGGSVAFETVDALDMLEAGQVFGGRVKGGYSSMGDRYTGSTMLYGAPNEGLELLGYFKYSDHGFGEDGRGYDIGGEGEDTSYLLKGSYSFLDAHRLALSYEHVEYDGNYPFRPEYGGTIGSGKKKGERAQAVLPQRMERDTFRFNYTFNPSDYLNLDLNAYYTDHALVRDELPSWREAKKAGKASFMDAGVATYGASLINTSKITQGNFLHTLRYGAEMFQTSSYLDKYVSLSANDDGSISEKPVPTVGDDEATSYSLAVEDAVSIGGLTVTPGVRLDYYELDTMGTWPNRASYDWTEVSPALATHYHFDNGIGLFGSYTRVFRGPDPIESIRLTKGVAKGFAERAIDPETGDAYEAGFSYDTKFGNGYLFKFLTKYFYTDYENLIQEYASPKAGTAGTSRVNAGEAVVDGVEIIARTQVGNFGMSAGYTHSETDYDSTTVTVAKGKDQAAYGSILGYSDSGDKYTLSMDYFVEQLDTVFGYSMIYFDSITTDDGFTKPSYAVHDIFASCLLSGALEGLEINVGVYNLFDEEYYSHSQRTFGKLGANDWEPGRSVRASIIYRF